MQAVYKLQFQYPDAITHGEDNGTHNLPEPVFHIRSRQISYVHQTLAQIDCPNHRPKLGNSAQGTVHLEMTREEADELVCNIQRTAVPVEVIEMKPVVIP